MNNIAAQPALCAMSAVSDSKFSKLQCQTAQSRSNHMPNTSVQPLFAAVMRHSKLHASRDHIRATPFQMHQSKVTALS